MGSSKAELVGYHEVSAANIANLTDLKSSGGDVASVSPLVMQLTVLLCLWLKLSYGLLFGWSRGEKNLN